MASAADIKKVQAAIGVTADGVMGPKTRAALVAWQQAHGLTADGIIGPQTLGAIGGTAAPGAAPGAPSIDQAQMAAHYGLALSVLNSDPDLQRVFNQAVAESWDPDRFTAELRNTNWYKNNSEAVRSAITLKNADPSTWASKVGGLKAQIVTLAGQLGANLDGGALDTLAEQATTLGWNNDQISQSLLNYVGLKDGHLYGQAAQFESDIRSYASSMGLRIGDDSIVNWVHDAMANGNTDGSKAVLANMAASAFPSLAEQIKGGQTVADIASPYKQAMGQILEVNPDSVDLFDPTIRSALSGVGKDGKPALKSIWQFENDLRKDPRWDKTQNAQDQAMTTANSILQSFGLIGSTGVNTGSRAG